MTVSNPMMEVGRNGLDRLFEKRRTDLLLVAVWEFGHRGAHFDRACPRQGTRQKGSLLVGCRLGVIRRHRPAGRTASAFPPGTDIGDNGCDVLFGPEAETALLIRSPRQRGPRTQRHARAGGGAIHTFQHVAA